MAIIESTLYYFPQKRSVFDAANFCYEKLKLKTKWQQVISCVIILLGNAILPTGAVVLWIAHNILEYQPMSLTIMPQSTDKYYLLVFAIATYATSFTLGILNTVPQLLGTEDIDYFTSPHIVKSLIPIWLNRSTFGRSILQHAYVLLHFANIMRLPVFHGQRGNTRCGRYNNWFGFILNVCAILYMFLNLASIAGIIFIVVRTLMLTIIFIIFYTKCFLNYCILIFTFLNRLKIRIKNYQLKRRVFDRVVENTKEAYDKQSEKLLRNLCPILNDDISQTINVNLRINDRVTRENEPSEMVLLKSYDRRKIVIREDTVSHFSARYGYNADNPLWANYENTLTICYDTNTVDAAFPLESSEEDGKWTSCLYLIGNTFKFYENGTDPFLPCYNYSHRREQSLKIDTSSIEQCPFRNLTYDASNHSLEMAWNCCSNGEPNNQISPMEMISCDDENTLSVEVDVPELLLEIKDIIRDELTNVVKDRIDDLGTAIYKIQLEIRKTATILTIRLSPDNDTSFYTGCNYDLILLTAKIGNYLRDWKYDVFSSNLNSMHVYKYRKTLDHKEDIGVDLIKYRYCYNHLTSLKGRFNNGTVVIVLDIFLFGILIQSLYTFAPIDSEMSFTAIPFSISIFNYVIVLLSWFITPPTFEEPKIAKDTLNAFINFKRGYRMFDVPATIGLRKSIVNRLKQLRATLFGNDTSHCPYNNYGSIP